MDFPKDIAGQNSKTVEIVRDLIKRILGREEEFSLTVKKSAQQRYAKESPMIMIPPVEVCERETQIIPYLFNYVSFKI